MPLDLHSLSTNCLLIIGTLPKRPVALDPVSLSHTHMRLALCSREIHFLCHCVVELSQR